MRCSLKLTTWSASAGLALALMVSATVAAAIPFETGSRRARARGHRRRGAAAHGRCRERHDRRAVDRWSARDRSAAGDAGARRPHGPADCVRVERTGRREASAPDRIRHRATGGRGIARRGRACAVAGNRSRGRQTLPTRRGRSSTSRFVCWRFPMSWPAGG